MNIPDPRRHFLQRCRLFAAGVLRYTSRFPNDAEGRYLSDQLRRSGMSVGANVHEAQAAQSRADFVSKMNIALKEAREAVYWLETMKDADYMQDASSASLTHEAPQLAAILARSINTAKQNAGGTKRER
jgi:four helix bundle protein